MPQSLVKNYLHISFSTKNNCYKDFAWQHGYGGFSVNPKQIDVVKKYIMNKETHH